jgi:HSP20 family protein
MSNLAKRSNPSLFSFLDTILDDFFGVRQRELDRIFDNKIDFLRFDRPRSNIYKKKDENGNVEYELKVEVPGFKKEDIKIKVLEDSVLLIEGDVDILTESDDIKCVEEFETKSFKRKYLISNLDKDSIKAKLEDGILTVNVSSKKREKIDEIVIE